MLEQQPSGGTATADRDPGAGLRSLSVQFKDHDLTIGPVRSLAAERARLSALKWQHFDVKRMGATIGAIITGVDLTSDLAEPVVTEISQALHDYKVIFFRDQPLTATQHVG